MSLSGGNFSKQLNFVDGALVVDGPFDEDGKGLAGEIMIRFVIIKKDASGDASTPSTNQSPLIALHYGFFTPVVGKEKRWSAIVPPDKVADPTALGLTADRGGPVNARAVATAVLITQPAEPSAGNENPVPTIQTVTWCSDVTVNYPATPVTA
jgi:hypothetical protein